MQLFFLQFIFNKISDLFFSFFFFIFALLTFDIFKDTFALSHFRLEFLLKNFSTNNYSIALTAFPPYWQGKFVFLSFSLYTLSLIITRES